MVDDKKQPEVLLDFADGGVYIKHKMENAVVELERRRINRDEARKAAKAMEALDVKKPDVNAEHVQLLVKELGIEKDEAEKALAAEKGDLVKTIVALTAPPS
jgi:NACalpha-BTF3-like transcription factor